MLLINREDCPPVATRAVAAIYDCRKLDSTGFRIPETLRFLALCAGATGGCHRLAQTLVLGVCDRPKELFAGARWASCKINLLRLRDDP